MNHTVDITKKYAISDEIISREIESELLIVPLDAGIGKLDDHLFSLNDTGKIIWHMLDGSIPLETIIENLSHQYEAPKETIASDVIDLVGRLLGKGLVIEI
jgi:hypothetical protein